MSARESPPPRVVLDTNVVLSALIFGGVLGALRSAWQNGRCRPLVSKVTAAELLRVLAYPKFQLTSAEQEELLSDYLPWCEVVRMPARPPRIPACRDPGDRPFLELALAGKADVLVTGDKDLHALASRFRCPIVEPAAFLASLV